MKRAVLPIFIISWACGAPRSPVVAEADGTLRATPIEGCYSFSRGGRE